MIAGELKTLWQLLRGVPRTGTHAERLQGFYAPQAAHYDWFRERLLEGRAELVEQLMIKAGDRVVELGAGTGRNAEYYRAQIPNLAGVELVDLCPALLAQARRRVIQWANVAVIEAELGGWPVTAVFIASTAPYWQSVTQSRRVVVDEWRRAKGKI